MIKKYVKWRISSLVYLQEGDTLHKNNNNNNNNNLSISKHLIIHVISQILGNKIKVSPAFSWVKPQNRSRFLRIASPHFKGTNDIS